MEQCLKFVQSYLLTIKYVQDSAMNYSQSTTFTFISIIKSQTCSLPSKDASQGEEPKVQHRGSDVSFELFHTAGEKTFSIHKYWD